MKKIIQTSFLLMALLLPATALAYDFEVNGIYYNFFGNTVSVTHGNIDNSYSGAVSIPNSVTYGGRTYSVSTIGDDAFRNCSSLTSVNMGNSVMNIGNYAFGNCSGLTRVSLSVYLNLIGQGAFSGCYSLSNVNIPNSVTYIGEYAFEDCGSLTSVNIPNSLTKIYDFTFYGCTSLKQITIPKSITSIGFYAFGHGGLTDLIWNARNCTIHSDMGTSTIERVTIGDEVTVLPNNFVSGSKITSVNIPNSVKEIGWQAFSGCRCLSSITLPNSLISIGDFAFYECCALANVTIPNTVSSIGSCAFYACSALTDVTIPNSVTSVGGSAFEGCTSLQSITLPNSITMINSSVFSDCIGLKSVALPNSLITIGNNAFSGCDGLTNIDLPNSLTAIEDGAFSGCDNLTSIIIPYSVIRIGDGAFSDCGNLNVVYSRIRDISNISMGSSVFYRAPNNYSNRTLQIPYRTLDAYQADEKWRDFFGTIVEMEPVKATSIGLNVTYARMSEGSILELIATVLPEDAYIKRVVWSSNDSNIATVNDNGLVSTHNIGTTDIIAVLADGSGLYTRCTVTLLPDKPNGDVDGDGNVNITDVTTLIDMLLSGSN